MSISVNDVEHVAKLARLELSEPEKQQFTEQLNKILNFMDKLNELDTENVKPTSHVIQLSDVTREDEVRPSWPIDKVMQNAPDEEEGQFRVPAILD